MRTTVKLSDDLLKEAKQVALASGKTLTQVIEDSLRETFARRTRAANQPKVDLPVFRGSKLLPGIDLDNSAALLEILDREE